MADQMKMSAVFSQCRTYRYLLTRRWDKRKYFAMFIGLNPSTADENNDDPTIRRCIQYAKDWGYGGLIMANLFAFRATDPSVMMKADNPIGPDNDYWLRDATSRAGIVVAAWGVHGKLLERNMHVLNMVPGLHYLRLTKNGHPGHPLYLPKKLTPVPFVAVEHV
ncbi:DUF1643 domain-containing protein [Methylomonas rosea]|uniref:DUF1643 domain-containing protein n=1 Tax=Methylomonas rosea TaxID=2952227 RepID=A0ABT1TMZ6_9GAMM|nr:DUF1643 domain-containing protein [Methylomonas sp. WSC-7]MCQ8116141.1 DUF1643 domain-containing protein [Methylomonas sp. WSC-7]